jgi:hypothetical protein
MKSEDETVDKEIAARLRTLQEGGIDTGQRIPAEWAGYVDEEILEILDRMERAFADIDESPRGNSKYEELVNKALNQATTRAVRDGNEALLRNIVGEHGDRNDVSGIQTIRKVRNKVARPAYVAYVYGVMGSGKTDFSLFLAELWEDEMDARNYDTELASNITSWRRSKTVDSYDGLLNWLGDAGNEGPRKLFVFDEASKHASGYADDAAQSRELGKLVNLFRKYQASLIVVGHTGKDIHPDILRKTTHVVHKRSKQEADVSEVETEAGGNWDDRNTLELSNIPKTNFNYDSYEASTWTWNEGESTEGDRMRRAYEAGLSLRQVAEVWDTSKDTVRRRIDDEEN